MVLLSPPPIALGASRKTTQEKKRRDEINAKIKELQLLIQEDSDTDKMTQSDVLNRAVEVVNRMESESPGPSTNPNRKGFFDGFSKIESLTYSFIRNLGVNSDVCHDFIHRAKECFDGERASWMSGNASPRVKKDIENQDLSRASRSPTLSEPGTSIDRREVKKNREQDRRDRQGESFDALKHFIIAHKLMSSHQVEKMQRLNTLDIIINYIRNKRNNYVSKDGYDLTLYSHALAEGQKTARRTALNFFKTDRHLVVRSVDLEKYFDFSLSPKPLLGFPPIRLPMLAPPPPPPAQGIAPFVFPFKPFPFFPMMAAPVAATPSSQPSPAYSLDSPPPSSDTSSSSIETVATPAASSSSKKIFRPWE